MSLEEEEIKRFKDKRFSSIYLKHPRIVYIVKEHVNL